MVLGAALVMVAVPAVALLVSPCFLGVDSSERGVVQTFGKFSKVADPGLNCIVWPFQTLTRVSTKVNILDCITSTKTEDNVSVQVRTVIHFAVDPTRVYDFYFKVTDVKKQLESYVDSIVRSEIPKYSLDAAYIVKDSLAITIIEDLKKNMTPYGVLIHSCLMADLTPDPSVLTAMNDINAARRQREANFEKAEAEKLLTVTQARAEAEAQQIAGEGAANKRRALATGFQESVEELKDAFDLEPREALHAALVGQYLDVLRDFAIHGRCQIRHYSKVHALEWPTAIDYAICRERSRTKQINTAPFMSCASPARPRLAQASR